MSKLTRRNLFKTCAAAAFTVAAGPGVSLAQILDHDPFIEALIARMSLEEKAGQLSIYSDPLRFEGAQINPKTAEQSAQQLHQSIVRGELTGLFNGVGAKSARALQKLAVEQSPHKIPLIFAADVIHGMKTVFPIPVAEASSFDLDLAERTARAAAVEASAKGLHWTFAPMVDVARDERWGRVAEGSGEDVYLGAAMARARVKGFQGRDLRDEDTVLACPKHFAAYGGAEGGRDYNTVDIPDTTLRATFLPPFEAGFKAGALTTMSSFNDIAGVPATGNHYLLTEILRGEWGFKGLVVSDYTGESELIHHGYAADDPDVVVKALTAGCDVSMQSGLYFKHIPDLVRQGRLPLAVVDEAVRRVLRVKKAIGLFDNPYRSMDPKREATDIRTPATVALAREAARKSVVLLKNDGALLPLKKSVAIALIGPCVRDKADLPGAWAVFPDVERHVTFEEGFRAAMGPAGRLWVARGSDYEAALPGGVEEALAAARQAEVIVLVVGESSEMSGEAQSRVDIGVPAPQLELAEALAKLGKPMVVLLRHGRALALSGAVRNAPAIMATWFLGSETGNAVADLVFGDFAPEGRLPVSFPQVSGQEPYYYNHRNTGRPQLTDEKAYKSRYREVANQALYPFGHGLSYSAVRYSATRVEGDKPILAGAGAITVSVEIENQGARACTEVVQLYTRQLTASITQPVRQLRGFKRVPLQPGEKRRVEFSLDSAMLAFPHPDRRTYAEASAILAVLAPNAEAGTPVRIEFNPA
jgi:beta-glucosidase